jgi:phage FluMu protein gp41
MDDYRMAEARGDPGAMVRSAADIGKLCGFYSPEAVRTMSSADEERLQRKIMMISDEELIDIAEGRARSGRKESLEPS